MNISSATSAVLQQVAANATRTDGKIEGNKPDGDGDRDDNAHITISKQATNPARETGSVGSLVNVKV